MDKNALLIDTAEAGDAARLFSAGPGCQLEGRPNVTAEELRSGPVARSVHRALSGQALIALVSTDSDFAGLVARARPREFGPGLWAS